MSIDGKSVLVVIPARGGSKGIPQKNLRQVGGISLVGRAAQLASKISWIDKTIVSTDDRRIGEEAMAHGADMPFTRPEHLASDLASSHDMWRHAWLTAEEHYGCRFDLSLLLEPTSPLRQTEDIERTVQTLLSGNWEAAATVSPTPAHFTPHKTLTVDDKGCLGFFMQGARQFATRQRIPHYYHRNGVCYAVLRRTLVEQGNIVESNCAAVVIERPLVNIDEPLDIEMAEWLLTRSRKNSSL